MTTRQMRLGLSVANLGYHYAAWRLPESQTDADHDIGHHIRSAQIAERGLMDFLFFADLAVVRDTDNAKMRRDMEQSHLKLEPSLICAALAALPGPPWLRVMVPLLPLLGSVFVVTVYADDIRIARLRQHDLPVPDDPDLGHPAH